MNQQPHLEFKLRAGNAQSGRGGKKDEPKEPAHSPTRPPLPRLTRLLALAHRWERLIEEGSITSRAEIARLMGLTPARVTQIMDLIYLPPEIQHDLLFQHNELLPSTTPERIVRPLLSMVIWRRQMQVFCSKAAT